MAFFGTEELVLVIVLVLVLFGATAIPKLARAMGRAKGEFTKAKAEFDLEAAKAEREASAPVPPAGKVAGGETLDEQIRTTARSLGIDTAGKDTAELKRLIQLKLA